MSLGERSLRWTNISSCWSLFLLRGPSPAGLRLLGVLLGFSALKDLLWSLAGYFAFNFPDRFFWPYLPVPRLPYDAVGSWLVSLHQVIATLGSLALIAGVFPRLGAVLLLFGYGYPFLADRAAYTNNIYVFLVFLSFYLLGSGRDPRAAAAAGRGIQLFISSIYLTGAVTKLDGFWCSGAILREALFTYQDVYGRWIGMDLPYVFQALSLGTIGVELLLALGLWHRRTRAWAMLCGIALHAGIEFFLPVRMFSYLMAGSYLLFLDHSHHLKIEAYLERRGPLWRATSALAVAWLINRFFARITGNYEYSVTSDFPLVSSFIALAALSRVERRALSPARSLVTPLLRKTLPALLLFQGWLLLKPAFGRGTDFSFRLFTETVQLKVNLWTMEDGAWVSRNLYGASHRWNPTTPKHTWGNWVDERATLEAYSRWAARSFPEAERVRVEAQVWRNLGDMETFQWEQPAPR